MTRTLTAAPRGPARTTSVWTPALCPAAREPTAQYRTTWPSAGVREEQLGILSGTADPSPGLRFVLLAGSTLTAR